MHVLARFSGPSGEIAIIEDRATGARLYREGGINQSHVRAGGDADVEYIHVMAALLGGHDVLLLGCGGGALAGMLHRRGCRVCVVEVNPLSFALARTFFWMPGGIECIATDMREFLAASRRTFDAIGIDVGGPHFSYEDVLDPRTIARVKRALRAGGRVAVNISCEAPDDPVPGRIAARFKAEGLNVWAFTESAERSNEVNAVILASARQEAAPALQQVFQHAGIAQDDWCLARLAG